MSEVFRDRIKSLRRVKASELVANPKNWRRHPEDQRGAMSAALAEIGLADALLVRETDVGLEIIDGHLRADLCADQKVPVLVLDVTAKEADKLLATFDPLTGMAEADLDALVALAGGLEFDNSELDDMLADLLGESGLDQITEDAPPPPLAPQEGPCVAHVGDVWACGRHRVMCGDSGSAAELDRLLDGQSIHLVNTDPPYNVNVEATTGIRGGRLPFAHGNPDGSKRTVGQSKRGVPGGRGSKNTQAAKSRPIEGDFLSDEEFDRRLDLWFGNLGRVLLPGRSFYIWGGWTNAKNYPAPLAQYGLFWSQVIIWHKQWPFYGRKDFMLNHEWCFYGWRKGKGHKFFGPNNVPDVWSIKKVTPQSMVHLTEKPVELAARAIQYSSRSKENVLDLFGGSGSTLIACEQLGRRAFIMEIDAMYVDVILQRYLNFTKVSPVRASDGALFSDRVTAEAVTA